MSRVAVYRCLYGEDFIVESINSILKHVERVFVCVAPRPWGSSKGVTYKGVWRSWPEKFDDLRTCVSGWQKVSVIDDFWPTPDGQYEHIIRDIIQPLMPDLSEVLIMEPDWVFTENEADLMFAEWDAFPALGRAFTQQVELWKTPAWQIHRGNVRRATPTLLRAPFDCKHESALTARVHNLGFASCADTMFWKHLTALAFAEEIKDSPPNPSWFDEKWVLWDPITNNCDLEISLGRESNIREAVPYDVKKLPASIKVRYDRGEWFR